MFWIIQTDLFQHNERSSVLDTLRRFDIPHQVVQVASDRTLSPDVNPSGPTITNGSVLLSKIANERGWQPGSFLNANFSYGVWHQHYRDHLLNRDATFTTVGEADPRLDEFFIRPLLDDKSFTGQTMTRVEFDAWQARGSHRPETAILYAPIKPIGQEHRHFIVNGDVVSSSRYKLGGKANQSRDVDSHIVAFARRMAGLWQPADAFVMDTYVCGNEIGIVEIGCICHAGYYQADVAKIIMTLDSLA